MFNSTVLKEMQMHVTVRSTLQALGSITVLSHPQSKKNSIKDSLGYLFVTSEVAETQFTAKSWKQSKYSVEE